MAEPEEFYTDPAFAAIYDAQNVDRDDFDFCLARAHGCRAVLDLGCGTGALAVELSEFVPRVVGADPAAAMLNVARARPDGDRVAWVEGDGRTLDLDETFDLIVMTGHAFQCLLSDADQDAILATMARHLAPGGRAIFDSRNPIGRRWEDWTPEKSRRSFIAEDGTVWTKWTSVVREPGEVIAYTQYFRQEPDGPVRPTTARLRWASKERLLVALGGAGLEMAEMLGDWRGGAWTESSQEIVIVARHRGAA
ncbi:MAG: class I SAM-dependent methyltransferase [Pseudomonadota bacterium]